MSHSFAPFQPEALVGATLDGRYRLVAHIASGGMGAIFKAEHVHLRKDLAIKVLRPDLTTSADLVERFRREAEIAATLAHENIVRVTDFGRSPEGWLFLAMEFLVGESLFERLRRDGAMKPEVALPILVQVCRGLAAAHERAVVHRDLKPENIFLIGEPPLAKILDFGIAKLTDPGTASETQAGMVVGTPEYLSPEQAMGAAVDGRADVYAVGLIAWRMLVGRHPFQAQDARGLVLMQATRPVPPLGEARPELGRIPGLEAAVAQACAKDPAERTATAGALADALEACLPAGSPRGAPPAARAAVRTPPMSVAEQVSFSRPGARPTMTPLRTAMHGDLPRRSPSPARAATPARPIPRAGSRLRTLALVGAVAATAAAAIGAATWLRPRPEERAEALLAAGKAEEARALAAHALERFPRNVRLRAAHARALARLPGQGGAAVEAWAEAFALDPRALDDAACDDLAAGLSQDRRVADRAAQLLVQAGPPAAGAVLRTAAGGGPGWVRIRALEVARSMGVEARVDRIGLYGGLLGDPDCEVRRAAARRLGELGNPAALPALRALAGPAHDEKGALGASHGGEACGAAEAAEAAARIERLGRP